MRKKVKKRVPELRFSEFHGDWLTDRTDHFLARHANPVDVQLETAYKQIGIRSHGKGIFHKDSVTGEALGNKRVYWVHPEAFTVNIVFAWEQAVALTSSAEEGYIASHRFLMFLPKDNKVDLKFVLLFFLRKRGKYLLELASPGGAGRNKTLGLDSFAELEITLPQREEQEKIAGFLGAVDARLTQLRCKRDRLQTYKRGVMQKIFSQQIRFRGAIGLDFPDWEKKKLEDIFKRVTSKNIENNTNVLTISAQYGLINQMDFFNKSLAANDLTGYSLLKHGDFAYNKSYSNGYPMGAIKRLNIYDKGIVSSLYICFTNPNEIESRFYEQYFDGGFLNHELNKIAQEGARNHGLLNMSIVEFFKDISIDRPTIKEQEKIANFLTAIDRKIEAISRQIDRTEQFKKGLLQKMFV